MALQVDHVTVIEDNVRQILSPTRVVVSLSTSRSRSRLEKNCQRLGLVSVSAIYVSCPRQLT